MSSWPIRLRPTSHSHLMTVKSGALPQEVEVIPADLGRELYEALRWYGSHADAGCQAGCECDYGKALARYEREVNDA